MSKWNNPEAIKKSREESKVRVLAISLMLQTGELLSSTDIMRKLYNQYGIKVDRKTIYNDICSINRVIPIDVVYGKKGGYRKCGGING